MIKKVIKIMALLAIIILVIFTYSMVFKTDSGEKNGNISNSGLIVESEEGKSFYYKYGVGIFEMPSGKKLTDESSAYSLNYADEKIYYLSTENMNKINIKCLDPQTNESKIISEVLTAMPKIYARKDNIFYSTYIENGGIVKIDLENMKEIKIINEGIKDFHVDFVNNMIYYINEHNQILSTNISGNNLQVISNEINANKFQIVQNWIYYYDLKERALFRVSLKGKNKSLISTLVSNDTYNVYDKYIYYFDESNKTISRMEIEKSNNFSIIAQLNANETKINIAKDKLYYLDKSQNSNQLYQMYVLKLNGEKCDDIQY